MFEKERVDMRIKYTREWTFEALGKLLEVKSFHDIKISEIIQKAGISRATFYRNFNNKEDIVSYKVKMFFDDFYEDIVVFFQHNEPKDERYFIQAFFKRINEEEKLVDTVIKTNLEYLMVDGIKEIIVNHAELFYSLVKSNKVTKEYAMEIVASGAWTLLSKWHKKGKKESPNKLAKIFMSTIRSVYIALFEDKENL